MSPLVSLVLRGNKSGESACTERPSRASERIVSVRDVCGRVGARERGLQSSGRDTARVYPAESGLLVVPIWLCGSMIQGRTQ